MLCAALALTLVLPSAAASTAAAERALRIGLYYGDNALLSANLDNSQNSGYRFGYYDNDLVFHQVGYTTATALTMVKDKNIYLSGTTYSDTAPSGSCSVIGAFHVQLDAVYNTFEDAAAAAASYTSINAFPCYDAGQYRVRLGSYTTQSAAAAAMEEMGLSGSAEAMSATSQCVTVLKMNTAKILFEYDARGASYLGISPGLDDNVKSITWFKNNRYYGGFQYKRMTGDNLTVTNVVGLDDYVRGILPYEMSNTWPLEALKAQAVCARSYSMANLGKHSSLGFDLCNTDDCQVYAGINKANDLTDQAVDETLGILAWYDGDVAATYYSSCNGGASECKSNVWGGSDVPYLQGVTDPYEADLADSISYYYWSTEYSSAELTDILQTKGYAATKIVDCYVSAYTDVGNALTVKFVDATGLTWSFSKNNARSILYSSKYGKNTRSQRFTIQSGDTVYVNGPTTFLQGIGSGYAIAGDGSVEPITTSGETYVLTASGAAPIGTSSGVFTVTGSGWGHNIGMSQWGANAMAKRGMTYDQILKFYFQGITLSQ